MIHTERHDAVILVRIDRPERKNALGRVDLVTLHQALDDAVADPSCRALVLAGSHGDFCSGADIEDATDPEFVRSLFAMLDVLRGAPIPTIASVDGYALGAGMQLAVACDLRVAGPGAKLGVPAGKLGLMIDHWTVQRLAGIVGQGNARALLLGGEVMTRARAVATGLVQRDGSVDDALAWAAEISGLAPITLAGHKRALAESVASADYEALFWSAWTSDDVREGVAAFRERRPPEFTGS